MLYCEFPPPHVIRRVEFLIVTSSSAADGWMPTVASNCALVAPPFRATAIPCKISGASGPTMCTPTTLTQAHSIWSANWIARQGLTASSVTASLCQGIGTEAYTKSKAMRPYFRGHSTSRKKASLRIYASLPCLLPPRPASSSTSIHPALTGHSSWA